MFKTLIKYISLIKYIPEGTLNLFFPPECLKCGCFLTQHNSFFTSERGAKEFKESAPFKKDLPGFSPGRVLCAGDSDTVFERLAGYFCSSCMNREQSGDKSGNREKNRAGIPVWAVSEYSGIIRESIHLLKYGRKKSLAKPLGKMLFDVFSEYCEYRKVDLLVPIPLHRSRLMSRGFNQAFLLVSDFRKYWSEQRDETARWRVDPFVISRVRRTESQTGFSREERQKNVMGAFSLRKRKDVRNLDIVLIDDVYTTGATTGEAASLLMESGASSVAAIVIAVA